MEINTNKSAFISDLNRNKGVKKKERVSLRQEEQLYKPELTKGLWLRVGGGLVVGRKPMVRVEREGQSRGWSSGPVT